MDYYQRNCCVTLIILLDKLKVGRYYALIEELWHEEQHLKQIEEDHQAYALGRF